MYCSCNNYCQLSYYRHVYKYMYIHVLNCNNKLIITSCIILLLYIIIYTCIIHVQCTGILYMYRFKIMYQACSVITVPIIKQVDNQIVGSYSPVLIFPSPSSGEIEFNYPVLSCFIERLPHQSPFAVVFRVREY